ncbi:MAG TPA: TPM domain-containing protein [Pedomonas sp.]|uniref:TPM domain-containing protein n=1 Tax=Pedomonas sp. TaxID=2976421 RepID=UPI002F40464D
MPVFRWPGLAIAGAMLAGLALPVAAQQTAPQPQAPQRAAPAQSAPPQSAPSDAATTAIISGASGGEVTPGEAAAGAAAVNRSGAGKALEPLTKPLTAPLQGQQGQAAGQAKPQQAAPAATMPQAESGEAVRGGKLTFPALTGRVVDEANILDPAMEQHIAQISAGLERQTSDQLVVVTLANLRGREIEEYGYQLGRHWGIGQSAKPGSGQAKDNGVLLIVAPNERRVRIEVGYGAEGRLTDALSSVIINQSILPRFRAGDFAGGILRGTQDITQVLGGDAAPFQELADRRPVEAHDSIGIGGAILFFIIWFFIARLVSRGGRRGRRGGSSAMAAALPFILMSGGHRGGGFGGGFGGGGFSGGGGSFGGGGASGGW